jgi:hypothetical protein
MHIEKCKLSPKLITPMYSLLLAHNNNNIRNRYLCNLSSSRPASPYTKDLTTYRNILLE